jgi:hypothetical protein
MAAPNNGFLGSWVIATSTNQSTYPIGAPVSVGWNGADEKYNLTWEDQTGNSHTMHQLSYDDVSTMELTGDLLPLKSNNPVTIVLEQGAGGWYLSVTVGDGFAQDDDGLVGNWTTNERPPVEEEPR